MANAWNDTTVRTKLTQYVQQHQVDMPQIRSASDHDVIDNVRPACVVFPLKQEHIATVTRFAYEHHLAIAVRGGGTQLHWGGVVEKSDILLDLSGMSQIIDYQPDDMTITVQAGCSLEHIQKTLLGSNQFLPVDPPLPHGATIGGIVATGAFGPLQHSYGPIRDYVIGIRAVRPNGDTVRAGGQVVKNAAGYELTKLFTGSYGTLGIVTELTLMVRPKPPAQAALFFPLRDAEHAERIIECLLDPTLQLTFIELLNLPAMKHTSFLRDESQHDGITYGLCVGFSGSAQSVAWQQRHIENMFSADKALSSLRVRPVPVNWEDAYEAVQQARMISPNESMLRAHLLSSEVVPFLMEAEHIMQRFQLVAPMTATAGLGIVHIALPAWPQRPQQLVANLQDAASQLSSVPNVPPVMPRPDTPMAAQQHAAVGLGDLKALRRLRSGRIVVESAPHHIRRRVPIWPSNNRNQIIMQRLQQQINPRQTINAGRLLGA